MHNSTEYLFSQLSDCCRHHYNWNYKDCIGDQLGAYSALYYPNFEGSNEACLTGGNQPPYMNSAPEVWMKTSLEECCDTYYGWRKDECIGGPTGTSNAVESGFYPDWDSSETRCLNSTETAMTVPEYMLEESGKWLANNIESCCNRYFNWAFNDCIAHSGGNSTGTREWYVNHKEMICRQACPKGNGLSCGGLAMPWYTMYDTPATCCAEELSWIASSTCEARSNPPAVAGTSKWYVHWSLEKVSSTCFCLTI